MTQATDDPLDQALEAILPVADRTRPSDEALPRRHRETIRDLTAALDREGGDHLLREALEDILFAVDEARADGCLPVYVAAGITIRAQEALNDFDVRAGRAPRRPEIERARRASARARELLRD